MAEETGGREEGDIRRRWRPEEVEGQGHKRRGEDIAEEEQQARKSLVVEPPEEEQDQHVQLIMLVTDGQEGFRVFPPESKLRQLAPDEKEQMEQDQAWKKMHDSTLLVLWGHAYHGLARHEHWTTQKYVAWQGGACERHRL